MNWTLMVLAMAILAGCTSSQHGEVGNQVKVFNDTFQAVNVTVQLFNGTSSSAPLVLEHTFAVEPRGQVGVPLALKTGPTVNLPVTLRAFLVGVPSSLATSRLNFTYATAAFYVEVSLSGIKFQEDYWGV